MSESTHPHLPGEHANGSAAKYAGLDDDYEPPRESEEKSDKEPDGPYSPPGGTAARRVAQAPGTGTPDAGAQAPERESEEKPDKKADSDFPPPGR